MIVKSVHIGRCKTACFHWPDNEDDVVPYIVQENVVPAWMKAKRSGLQSVP